jgi:hypothetical protein
MRMVVRLVNLVEILNAINNEKIQTKDKRLLFDSYKKTTVL